MALLPADIDHLAELARLRLSDEERAVLGSQLGRILEFARQVDEVDTTDVPATDVGPELAPVERADESRPSLDTAEILQQAPDAAGGLFRVPRVLDPRADSRTPA